MEYCSKQDLIDRFDEDELIRLTDRDNLGVINDVVLSQAITDASAEMDLYLSRFQLSLDDLPSALKSFACDITRYRLYDDQASEQVTKRYDGAMKSLLAISQGKISIGKNDSGTPVQSADLAQIESAGSVFSRNSSNGFI